MIRYMQVTIDGPSASGKSTIAQRVAEKIKFHHLDSGAIYRSLAYVCYLNQIDPEDKKAVSDALSTVRYEVQVTKRGVLHRVNDLDVTLLIRQPQISQYASKIATNFEVREIATRIQRDIAKEHNVIVEGRDAGTVVFPNADMKFYLTASREERAKRRLKELASKSNLEESELDLDEVMREMEERDARDTGREISPLTCAVDAFGIDTTGLSIRQVVNKIVQIINKNKIRPYSKFWAKILGKERARATIWYKMACLLTFLYFRVFHRIEIHCIDKYPKGPAIIAPNHVSFLDPPAIGMACPNEVYALAASYLFKIPIVGAIISRLNTLSVSGNAGDIESIKTVVGLLKRGKQVVIFPEGSRSPDGEIAPLRRGVGLLASMGNAAIVPTIILGASKAWKKGQWLPKPWGKMAIVFGDALYWHDYESKFPNKKLGQAEMVKDLEKSMRALQAEYREKLGIH